MIESSTTARAPVGGAEKTVLYFPVLVYRDEITAGRQAWFARSVLTGDVAPGENQEEAIYHLGSGLMAAIQSAQAHGISPETWYSRQAPDDPEWVVAWCRCSRTQPAIRTLQPPQDGWEIEVGIIQREAA